MTFKLNLSECPELLKHFKELYPVEHWKVEGFFEDDDLLSVSCHWLGFNPPRPSLHFLLAVIYILVFLIGLLSNSLVLYVIGRRLTIYFSIYYYTRKIKS